MGYKVIHICDSCDYQAMISGKRDCGFFTITQTFECPTCQLLEDYELGGTPAYDAKTFGPIQEPMCEDCGSNKMKVWNRETGGCPKCGSTMRVDEELGTIHWD